MSDITSINNYYIPVNPDHIKRERQQARELRGSQWWKQNLQRGECYYCGQKFPATELTMDHKVPVGRGGCSTRSNVVVSCKSCNSNKRHLTPAEMILGQES